MRFVSLDMPLKPRVCPEHLQKHLQKYIMIGFEFSLFDDVVVTKEQCLDRVILRATVLQEGSATIDVPPQPGGWPEERKSRDFITFKLNGGVFRFPSEDFRRHAVRID
jgi:hypothetical protein